MRKLMQAVVPAVLLLGTAPAAVAQDYPSKPIEMIVPFGAGGTTDLIARALQEELSKGLGVPVVVVNKGGAGGTLGNIEVSQARPHGYTIGFTPNNALTVQPHLKDLPYTLDSFRYVCLVYDNTQVLIAGPNAPFKTFEEFAAFSTSKPDALVYGTLGPGSSPHILMIRLLEKLGVEQAVHVPFQGAGEVSQALMGNTIMVYPGAPANAKANNLPVLASFSKERIEALPDVPSTFELGYDIAGFSAGGIIAPAGTPDEVVAKLERACETATASQAFKDNMEKLASTVRYLPSAEFEQLFREDSEASVAALKSAGLTKK